MRGRSCSSPKCAAVPAILAILASALLRSGAHAARAVLQDAALPAASLAAVTEYTWHVTVSSQAPDCFQRDVLLVNGTFQPTLEVVQGDFLKVKADAV